MSLMHDVVFCNFFLQKFLLSRTNMMDLLHFMSLYLDVLFIQYYGLFCMKNKHFILGQSILFLCYHVTKIFVN